MIGRYIKNVTSKIGALSRAIKKEYTSDSLEYEFLPPSLEIEESPPSPGRRILIWVIFAILLITFAWSYFGKIDEIAVARGKIIPDGKIKVIQPIETGVIRAIHVVEGQRVQAGQMLIELDPTIKQADAEASAKRLSIHLTQRERLIHELGIGPKALSDHNGAPKHIIALQRRLKESRESEFRARVEAQKLVVSQRENALKAAGAGLTKLKKTYALTKDETDAYQALYEKGYTARMELVQRQKQLYGLEHDIEAQEELVKQAKDSLAEAGQGLSALMHERERGIFTELLENEKDITEFEGEVVKARKRFELEMLQSPVDGTVHGLASYTVGGVVTPAQPIVTIVPEGTRLVIEAMAENKDIGFIKVGQAAEVKLDTFPFQKYGTINGRVAVVSPDAFDDEKQGPIYKIRVELEKNSIQVDGKPVLVSPGMSASVEIKTGKRRIIEFFLSPIIKYADESLTLR